MRLSKIPEIAALQKEVPEGHCAFCEDPIPGFLMGGMPPVHCGSHECEKSYHRVYRRLRSEKYWAMGLNAKGQPLTYKVLGHRKERAA